MDKAKSRINDDYLCVFFVCFVFCLRNVMVSLIEIRKTKGLTNSL